MFKGEDIRKKRKESGLSAKELADKIEVNVDNLYKWEKGHTPTNPEDFLKIEKWLSEKSENVPRGIGNRSNNGSATPSEAQHGPDYKDRYIQILEELNEIRRQSVNQQANFEQQVLSILQSNRSVLKAFAEVPVMT